LIGPFTKGEKMWVLCLATLIVISITHWVYRWRNPSCNGKLPPGSLGFPLLGESLQFFTPYTSSDINPFIKQRMNRYIYASFSFLMRNCNLKP